MNYTEFVFNITSEEDYHRDLLINALAGIGFDTFEETDNGFKAYVPSDELDEHLFNQVVEEFQQDFSFSWTTNQIPRKNWNEVWESNFEPLEIGSCYVRATFHAARPEFPYQVVIDPKMAFGTGHHETTSMMIELILKEEFNGKSVLDMGCGTGILAILASMRGAKEVTAIDNDPVCYESTVENAELNGIAEISVICGSKEAVPEKIYDVILANINRNILLDQLPVYVRHLKPGGSLFMSGFYEIPDLEIITGEAGRLGLSFVNALKKKEWVAAEFRLSSGN